MIDPKKRSDAYKKVVLGIKKQARNNILSGENGLSSTVDIPYIRKVLVEKHATVFNANEILNLIQIANEFGISKDLGWVEETQISKTFSTLIDYLARHPHAAFSNF